MPLKPDILGQVEALLRRHNRHEPDPEKKENPEASAFMSGFREIEDFIKTNGRLPEKGSSISERKLAVRLKSIVEDDGKRSYLAAHDREGIIAMYCEATGFIVSEPTEEPEEPAESVRGKGLPKTAEPVVPASLKGLAGSSAFARIMGGAQKESSLFGGRFANKPKKEQAMPDYVAQRKDCADFEKYRPFFDQCLAELKSGARKAIPFKNEQHIEEGKFYVLGGLLCYVAEKGKPYSHKGKTNTRLRLIFVNERESDMLLRSLSTELYKGGLMITENESELFETGKITPDDIETGWIYVLSSLSKSSQVQAIGDLYKIGFTTGTVEERIANAEKFVTYLCAPVKVVAKARTANLSTHTLEQIIHAVFGKARLDIEVIDRDGQIRKATEWFSAPWPAIQHALQLIANGQIEYYDYNPETREMEFRKS
ncbi:GIY-YIG nuclease family protein [Luteolibacter sp. LG18]|uniref:GIY-YIG nuclease family protein n=1 Tax=Luteolibacter sp. LG18 TaxID=2819286 RepID=UPI002B2E0AF7|nr:hypothetical protein llg_15650 [Luteolibacter sp. LG18]